jgi:hypothetical protein
MKRLIIFILILASSLVAVLACSFYPYGDDIRFTIFNPTNFKYADFYNFNYTSKFFYGDGGYPGGSADTTSKDDENIILWQQYCKNKIPYESIDSAVYIADTFSVVNCAAKNLMLQYLHTINDTMAINYLLFAKQAEDYNMTYDDPWERSASLYLPKRTALISAAINKAAIINNESIQLRYAFLAERLAYYNDDSVRFTNVYQKYFASRKKKNIIDYWALSFKLQTQQSSYEKNFYLAQVFANASDKRMVANNGYDNKLSLDSTLHFATTNNEKAAVWLMAGINNPGRAISAIENMYTLQPNAKGVSFLLLREINKLEDWIYTPYYTYFTPSVELTPTVYPDADPSKTSLKRVDSDRVYATHLLEFINLVNINKTSDPLLWNTAKAYLYCMTNKYDAALVQIKQVQKLIKKGSDLYTQLELIKALSLTAKQTPGNVVIPSEVKKVLLDQYHKSNYRFIFAIARELEYKGNTTQAALLFSKINDGMDASFGEGEGSNAVYWRTKKNYYTRYIDIYSNCFDYIEAQYTPDQTQQLINSIASNKATDSFSVWEYSNVKNSVSHLYDLLGTKYIRKNNLPNALTAFKKVNDTLWKSSLYDYKPLNANPFYTNFYNEHELVAADSIHFTKTSITQTLINYLNKANDVNNKDRDYYYFLVANCYLNMTEYGNSWMMRRYAWTSAIYASHLEDDDEYYNCTLAKTYYFKAKQFTTNEKFAALCLRMVGRCEKYKLLSTAGLKNQYIEDTTLFRSNKYYAQLKKDYPQDYDELISNCESFNKYFATRDISAK